MPHRIRSRLTAGTYLARHTWVQVRIMIRRIPSRRTAGRCQAPQTQVKIPIPSRHTAGGCHTPDIRVKICFILRRIRSQPIAGYCQAPQTRIRIRIMTHPIRTRRTAGNSHAFRPASKSESERQRARKGASASERQYIRASRSERNLEQHVIFFSFYSAPQLVAMSLASIEHMGTQYQSCFQCFNSTLSKHWLFIRVATCCLCN